MVSEAIQSGFGVNIANQEWRLDEVQFSSLGSFPRIGEQHVKWPTHPACLRRTPYADAYRKYADLPITELKVSERDTAAEAGVKSILRQAIQEGSVHAIRETADRTEGRVPLPLASAEGANSSLPPPQRILQQSRLHRHRRSPYGLISAAGRIHDQVTRLIESGKQMTGYHSITY